MGAEYTQNSMLAEATTDRVATLAAFEVGSDYIGLQSELTGACV